MNTHEELNLNFRIESIDLMLNIFYCFSFISFVSFLFTYFIGNKLIYKNNKIRKCCSSIIYIEIIKTLSLIISISSLFTAFLIYLEVDS